MTDFDLFKWANETPQDKSGQPIADAANRPWKITESQFSALLKQAKKELSRWYKEQCGVENKAKLLWRLEAAHCELAQAGDTKGAARIARTIGDFHAADVQEKTAARQAKEKQAVGANRGGKAIAARISVAVDCLAKAASGGEVNTTQLKAAELILRTAGVFAVKPTVESAGPQVVEFWQEGTPEDASADANGPTKNRLEGYTIPTGDNKQSGQN